MKNRPFILRLGFAVKGIRSAWRSEASFRIQIRMGLAVLVVMVFLKPRPVWWGLIFLAISGVLSAELFNTALEHLTDRLHPKKHPMIAKAKDCAAGAVLLLSIASAALFIAMLFDRF